MTMTPQKKASNEPPAPLTGQMHITLEGRDLELLNAFRQAAHALSRPPQGELIDNYFAVQSEKARANAMDLARAISHMIDSPHV